MLLMIDIGNTNITLGLYEGGERKQAWRLATVHDRMPDEYGLQVLGLLEHAGCTVDQIEGCALASVVPPLTGTFVQAAVGYLGTEPLVIDAGVKTGLSIRYEDPKNALGADRVADAVAVRHFYGTPACVVDFGTATTFDAISAEGEYLGGAIAPGMDLASGLVYGYVGLVEGMVARFKEELGKETKVIGTGGLVDLIASETEVIEIRAPWLTLDGLQLIWDMNTD
jgi:type III pantothenate kinase